MSALNIQINSARKATQYESVKSIVLPSIKGEIEVLPEHMPLITELELGDVIIELSNGQKLDFLISRGYARIANNEVTLLLDEVDLSDELVKEEIEQAIANAEKMIGSTELPPSELIQLEKRLRYERFKLNKSNL
jgi:F-type H+-transporting ATPase subunit epsilon